MVRVVKRFLEIVDWEVDLGERKFEVRDASFVVAYGWTGPGDYGTGERRSI